MSQIDTALELMPVAEFPGSRGWGYDGVYIYAPFAPYGGPAGLAAASLAARAGVNTVLFDENPGIGGQIYRGITATPVSKPERPSASLGNSSSAAPSIIR